MTTITTLTPLQQRTVDRAKTVLGVPSGSDTASLATRIGQLEWHLAEMISLVGEVTGDEQ